MPHVQAIMVFVVLLMGADGVGKSTVAQHLVKGYGFVELSFAAALRKSAIAVWNGIASMTSELPSMSMEDTQDRASKESPLGNLMLAGRPLSPRVLLQWFGTDIMRNMVSEDIWVHAALAKLRSEIDKGATRVVFSDCRFSNELEGVKRMVAEYDSPSTLYSVRLVHGKRLSATDDKTKHVSARSWETLPADVDIVNPMDRECMSAWLTTTCEIIYKSSFI